MSILVLMQHISNRVCRKAFWKKEAVPPKKRGRKSKEEHAAWLAEQADIEANLTTYEKKIEAQLAFGEVPHFYLFETLDTEGIWN